MIAAVAAVTQAGAKGGLEVFARREFAVRDQNQLSC